MKSRLPEIVGSCLLVLFLGAALGTGAACSRRAEAAARPALTDRNAGITLALPETATAFDRPAAAKDRFVSRIPYGPRQTLLYLHVYSPPLVSAVGAPPATHGDVVERVLRNELGAFLTLETSATNLPDQTPVLLLAGRAREPDQVVGFAFQCIKTHFVFFGLSGPDVAFADLPTFFATSVADLRIADVGQSTFADAAEYQDLLGGSADTGQSLEFIRNVFASRNANPVNYTTAIGLAFFLARDLHARAPADPRLPEVRALLDNMASIRLADFLKGRTDFEVACGQGKGDEALAQARFLADLSYPFDAEARALDKQRLRKAAALLK